LSAEKKKEIIKKRLVNWYFSSASGLAAQRLRRYRNMLNIEPAGIIIRNQQKRWGSCSSTGVLRFNWRIAMAPVSIIDYVIVHELCHLKEKNHSREFWRQVSLAVPDYQKRRKWLKENSASLNF
jgi:predicted metal-dependent hydrolase